MKVLTIFFTLAVARSLFCLLTVLRPKSDRLSNEKEKSVMPLSCLNKRLRVKVARYLRVREKREKIFLKSKETCEFAL